MSDLLDLALDAHGGLKRWSGVRILTAKLAAGGPFWGQQGFPDAEGLVVPDARSGRAVVEVADVRGCRRVVTCFERFS
jgi:hypothetical protein